MKKFNLREGKDVQTYGIGIKEVWEIPKEKFQSGLIQHTLGWPLQDGLMSKVFGGTFLYHMEPNLVLTGMVVGLDYANPYLNPYQEFQRWKQHPSVKKHLEGGTCISYGARALNEGGYHAIPKLTFPGGALLGCSAGFLNSVKIKGSHTAMKSGMVAAEAIYPLLTAKGADETVAVTGVVDVAADAIEAVDYEKNIMASWVGKELFPIRNTHTAFKSGLLPGMLHTSFSCFISKGNEPWTLKNIIPDSKKTEKASMHKPIVYPKPDGKLSFDLLSNLARSGTSHEADQPAHLRIKKGMEKVPSEVSITEFAGPEQRFCPAGVYEYAEKEGGKKDLVINAQNCVHCKTCSIKMPEEYIDWTVPEGSGGPGYTVM
jgi:electron-transferring-flavoprotein dehydrogenase